MSSRRQRAVLTARLSEGLEYQSALQELSIDLYCVPTTAIVFIEPTASDLKKLTDLTNYSAICFSSRHGVEGLVRWLQQLPMPDQQNAATALAKLRGAAVGERTATLMQEQWHHQVEFPRQSSGAQALLEEVISHWPSTLRQRILLAQALGALPDLKAGLAKLATNVDVLTVYQTIMLEPMAIDLTPWLVDQVDWTIINSPSAFTALRQAFLIRGLHSLLLRQKFVTFGATTAHALQQQGYLVHGQLRPTSVSQLRQYLSANS